MPRCAACQRDFLPGSGNEVPYRCPHCSQWVLGPYCGLERIGGGGMGDVYRAREPGMYDRVVAIKIPRSDASNARMEQRFEREIAASARLQHENVVRAYARGMEQGRPYLVMEFVVGRKLVDVIRDEHPMAPRRVAAILCGLARGLEHAEMAGVVNRDIKPDNVFLSGDESLPKILDYGLALIQNFEEQVTRHGSVLGTPSYAAPEQFRDPHTVDIRADVYSLGCTGFCCLTGHPPFLGANLDDLCRQHGEAPRPSVRESRPDVPESFDRLIQSMMAPRAADRPSPRQIAQTLSQLTPTFSDRRPTIPGADDVEHIDVECPGCGDHFKLAANVVGQRMRCPHRTCGTIWTVPAPPKSPPPEVFDALLVPPDTIDARPIEDLERDLGVSPSRARPPGTLNETTTLDAQVVPESSATIEVLEARAVSPSDDPVDDAIPLDASAGYSGIDILPARPGEPASAGPSYGIDRGATPAMPEEAGNAIPLVAAVPGRLPGAGTPLPDSPTPVVAQVQGEQSTVGDKSRKRKVKTPARPLSAADRRMRNVKRAALVGLAFLIGTAAALLVFVRPAKPPDAWEEIVTLVREHKWDRALRKLEKFEQNFPEDPHLPEIPFFRDLCQAGPDVYRPDGDAAAALKMLVDIFKQHRDNPAYKEHCGHLYDAGVRLVEREAEAATKNTDAAALDRARQCHEFLQGLAQAMEGVAIPEGQDPGKLETQLIDAQRRIRVDSAQRRVKDLAAQRQNPEIPLDELYPAIRAAYLESKELPKDLASLENEKEYLGLLSALHQEEPRRVTYRPEPEDGSTPPADATEDPGRQGNTLVVAWGGAGETPRAEGSQDNVLALARGILYVFSKQGELLWSRRLGIDSGRLPQRIPAGPRGPASLIAVSAEDNTLLALETAGPQPGRVRWRYRVGQSIVAPLTVVPLQSDPNKPLRHCGLLPTADGEIHVLEVVMGRRLGRYSVGQPMALGGTYDPTTRLVFFPADAKRVFAIEPAAIENPTRPACRSVLLTGHASGSLRGEPVVVGPYLILSEASELDQTNLKVFALEAEGFAGVTEEAKEQWPVQGWAWFPPHATPDRVTLLTDRGDLGVFGLNLDNRDEALYAIVQDQDRLFSLATRDAARTLVAHSEEHLLWVMAGGRLHLLSVDVIRQQVRPLWTKIGPQHGASGIPVHEAQVDREAGLLFLVTMSPGGQVYRLTAVEAETGVRRWQRQLGMSLLGDPLCWGEHVVLLDRTGEKLVLRPGSTFETAERPRMLQMPKIGALPEGIDESRILRLGNPPEAVHLIAPADGGKNLAIRTLHDPNGPVSDWASVPLPEPLCGRPAVVGQWLYVPCINPAGNQFSVHRLPLPRQAADPTPVLPFHWTPLYGAGKEGADLYPLGGDAVLLVDQRRRLLRLEMRTKEAVRGLEQVGEAFHLSDPAAGPPILLADRLQVFDSSGRLYRLDAANPNRELAPPASTGVKLLAGPYLRERRLVVIDAKNRLVCFPADAGGDVKPAWVSEDSKRGRICGEPVLAKEVLLVADNSRNVSAVRLRDGETLWKEPLRVNVGPGAAAVPYGPGKVLVPLADGTVLILVPRPKPGKAA